MEQTVHTLSNGTIEWRLDNRLHREDGPAVESGCGFKEWWNHGRVHREDGPAVIWPNGDKEWYLSGRQMTFDTWISKLEFMNPGQGTMMKLEHG